MCRLCGRMIKCIFDSMPSKIPTVSSTRTITTATRARPARQTHISSSTLVKSALNVDSQKVTNPPTFLLPFRANLHQATTTQQAVSSQSHHQDASALPPSMLQATTPQSIATNTSSSTTSVPSIPTSTRKPLVLSKSIQQLLPSLTAQKPHYITAHVHRFPYLLQTGDSLRLPFHMSGVSAGDVLRLNRASIIGSRDFTLKAGTNSTETYDAKRTGEPNYLDERLFEVRARVMSVDTGPMFTKEKTKRRNRMVKTVRSKHKYTVLKIMEVRVKSLEELLGEKDDVLLQ